VGLNNGTVLGATKIVDNGSDLFKYTLVLLSEGYTSADMPQWESDAQVVADFIIATPPFSDDDLKCALNIYRIDVVSEERGADDPRCGGDGEGERVKTYFDATFCSSQNVRRTMTVDSTIVLLTALTHVPFFNDSVVIVNSPIYGAAAGTFPVVSKGAGLQDTVVHELGHSSFGLADEYDYYGECAEEGHNVYVGFEPSEPNVTMLPGVPGFQLLKWDSLVEQTTDIPTTTKDDCTTCTDPADPNPIADDRLVGAFVGARYHHCGLYRPEFYCRMKDSAAPPPGETQPYFCVVCTQTIRDTLAPFAQPLSVTPRTTSIAFPDTEAGTTVPSQITFDIEGCVPTTFEVIDGPRRLDGGPEEIDGRPVLDLPLGEIVNSPPEPGRPRTASIWVTYNATDPGAVLLGTITVTCTETLQSFTFVITGNTIAPTTAGVLLCLDRSASMTEPANGGDTKAAALRYAASVFVDIIPPDEGIGILFFDTDADNTDTAPADAGVGTFGAGRVRAQAKIDAYEPDPQGLTSLGDAVSVADNVLSGASDRYDQKAMVVFTDGMETATAAPA
jgi:IgA Peptidase M64/von Willebrand factor type A domain